MSLTTQQSDVLFQCIVSWIIGIVFCAFVFAITGSNYSDGYKQAYQDTKIGKVEYHMKQHYPMTWMELNVHADKPTKPEVYRP